MNSASKLNIKGTLGDISKHQKLKVQMLEGDSYLERSMRICQDRKDVGSGL